MKDPYILPLLALTRLSTAQVFSGQPECAVACLREFIPQAGCALEDTECQCQSSFQTALQPLTTPCLIGNCSADELTQAINAASAMCEALRDGDALTSVVTETIAGTMIIPTSPAAPRTSDVSTAGESSSVTATTTSSPSSTLVSSTSASRPTDNPSSSTSSGLNPAAIGLGVGIGVGGLLIILLALFLFRRHRKRRTSPSPDLSPAPPSPDKAELPNTYITEKPADDDPTHGRAEAPPHEPRYEIPTNEGIQGRHELDTSNPPSWHQRHP